MKILRVRTGFTTNSSSAAEWVVVEPETDATAAASDTTPATTTPAAATSDTAVVKPMPKLVKATADRTVSNTVILGLLVAGLALLFALERLIRKAWRRRQKDHGDA